ncbi:MAG TPA: hypothetical protein DF383_13665, partial [Deltaproteobacteria bacterium]|nr:hypothetical protein [Deltaproteobacteria bacterium]
DSRPPQRLAFLTRALKLDNFFPSEDSPHTLPIQPDNIMEELYHFDWYFQQAERMIRQLRSENLKERLYQVLSLEEPQ